MAIDKGRILYSSSAMGCGFFIFFQTREVTLPAFADSSSSTAFADYDEDEFENEDYLEIDTKALDEDDLSDIIALLELSELIE